MEFYYKDLINALACSLDYIELEAIQKVTNHNRRTAYFSVRIGEKLGIQQEELVWLWAISMLHDCGSFISTADLQAWDKRDDFTVDHCIRGEKILASLVFYQKFKNTVLYHHEFKDGSGFFGLQGDEIPLFSKIIHFADTADKLYNGLKYSYTELMNWAQQVSRQNFEPEIVDAFLSLKKEPAFRLDITDVFLPFACEPFLIDVKINRTWEEVHHLSQIFSQIIDLKSEFTLNHSQGISQKLKQMASYYHFTEEKTIKLCIAGDLHDVGKIAIPNKILNKPGKLTPEERNIIYSHPFFTRKILEKIRGFEDITEWASNHHETLDGKGYPYGTKNISFEARLLTVIDIYQALTEDRPYRQGTSHEEAITVLQGLVKEGKIDSQIVHDVSITFPYNE